MCLLLGGKLLQSHGDEAFEVLAELRGGQGAHLLDELTGEGHAPTDRLGQSLALHITRVTLRAKIRRYGLA